MAILTLREVSLDFGGPPLLDRVDWTVDRGERICLLGRNGEGKSTLLKLIDGELSPDGGEIVRQQGLRVARLPQEVPQEVSQRTGGSIFAEVADGLCAAGHELPGAEHRVEAVLSRMELSPYAMFSSLSAGMKRRVLLAKAIVGEPDILLLDEPTNHLDIDAIRWLEGFLLRFGGTLIFVTHDRALLEQLATRIVELDRGRLFDWRCDYPTFLERKEAALAAEARQNELFDKRLAQEEVWIRKGIEARRTRNEGRVRALKAMREERRRRRDVQGVARIEAQQAEASGRLVIEAKGASFAYGARPVIQNLTTSIMRGDKVGIIGPNGSGKTTLLRLLLGDLPPLQGTVRHGTRLEVAYFDQLKATLHEEQTVQENVTDYETITFNGQSRHILGYLQDFLFTPERSRTLVKFLSGGERSRLLLARLFTKPSNVLVFDEPTNDLDLETLELLASLLAEYQGTVLLVSHDRAFLNDVATSMLAIEAGGTIHEYAGGYDDYLLQRPATSAPICLPASVARKAARPQQERRARLTYQEKQELAALPQRIETLEARRRDLHNAMSDPAFYQRPGAEIAQDNARLSALEQELVAAYDRWESLESLAD
ncbi:MAG TPA: ATP-binding cassette domain-containing protein [Pirellulales bacterium]|nr:ATP-binding cassette domain-containing protein [Pirellulales bacterium]